MHHISNGNFSKVKLSDRLELFCLHKEEARIIYEQVQEYFKHGIQVNRGDTVCDVGANIGVFSLYTYHLCDRDVNIYAFEPIPKIFQEFSEHESHTLWAFN